MTSYRKVIKEKNRIVPPRGHDDLEVEPEYHFDGYSGLYKPDYIYEIVTVTDDEGESYESMIEILPVIDSEEKYGWFPGDSHCGPRHSVKVSDNQKARLASSSFWSEMGVVAATLDGKLEASLRSRMESMALYRAAVRNHRPDIMWYLICRQQANNSISQVPTTPMSLPIIADINALFALRPKGNETMLDTIERFKDKVCVLRAKGWDEKHSLENACMIGGAMLNACVNKEVETEFHEAVRNFKTCYPTCTSEWAEARLLEWDDNARRVTGQVVHREVRAAVSHKAPWKSESPAGKNNKRSAKKAGFKDNSDKGAKFAKREPYCDYCKKASHWSSKCPDATPEFRDLATRMWKIAFSPSKAMKQPNSK